MGWVAVLAGQDGMFPTGAEAKPAICLRDWLGKTQKKLFWAALVALREHGWGRLQPAPCFFWKKNQLFFNASGLSCCWRGWYYPTTSFAGPRIPTTLLVSPSTPRPRGWKMTWFHQMRFWAAWFDWHVGAAMLGWHEGASGNVQPCVVLSFSWSWFELIAKVCSEWHLLPFSFSITVNIQLVGWSAQTKLPCGSHLS